jgi:hypothetical protein
MGAIIDSSKVVPAQRVLELGWPVFWAEEGVVHTCTGFELHPGVTLLVTVCGRDVPANHAYSRPDAATTCSACGGAPEQGPQVL